MIRILNILKSLDIGGMERLVVRLANRLNNENFESHICCIDEISTIAGDFEYPDRFFVLGNKGRINAKSPTMIRRYIKHHSIDIIHAHNTAGLLYGYCPSIIDNKPIIYTLHGLERDYESKNVINRIEKWMSHRVSAYVCVSMQLSEYMDNILGIDHEKMCVIYNGVYLHGYENDLFIDDNQGIRIGSVGRLSPVKNYKMLIKASTKIIGMFSNCTFTIVGGGEEYDSLVRLRDALGLQEKMIFVGPVDDVDVHLKEMNIFVLTSLSEGISLSILEAMSMGKICVVSNVGGNMEIIRDKENGFIFQSDDEDDFINTLGMVIRNLHEPWMDDVRLKARQTVRDRFSIAEMVVKYSTLYKKLMSES